MPRSTILWLTCYACISSCEQIYSAEYLPRHKASISSICGVWITLACCNQTTCDISRHLYYITMSLTTNTTASLMMQGVAYKGIPHQVSVVELPSPTHRNIMTASLNIKSSKCTSTSKMRGKKKQFSGSQTTSTSVVRESNDGFAVLMRSSAFMRGCCSTDGTINPNFLQQCSTFIFHTAASYVKSLSPELYLAIHFVSNTVEGDVIRRNGSPALKQPLVYIAERLNHAKCKRQVFSRQ